MGDLPSVASAAQYQVYRVDGLEVSSEMTATTLCPVCALWSFTVMLQDHTANSLMQLLQHVTVGVHIYLCPEPWFSIDDSCIPEYSCHNSFSRLTNFEFLTLGEK
jgi:hypothetical protein